MDQYWILRTGSGVFCSAVVAAAVLVYNCQQPSSSSQWSTGGRIQSLICGCGFKKLEWMYCIWIDISLQRLEAYILDDWMSNTAAKSQAKALR